MLEINSRFAVIDGWLVDVLKRKPINFWCPEIRLLLPNDSDYEKLLRQNLLDWTQLKKDSTSILVGVYSAELFKHIRLVLREFFLLEDGRIVLKRMRNKLHYKVVKTFARKCCRLFLPKWGTIYIYPLLQDNQVCSGGVRQFALNVEPNLEYPLIDIDFNYQYTIIEGFLLYLNERRPCKWNDNDLRNRIGLKAWASLKKLYNPMSLDIVYNLDSNYYFVKDDRFFQLLGRRVFVKFSEVMKNKTNGNGPSFYCARTTTAKATHIAYVLTDTTLNHPTVRKNVYRFIVRERPIVEDITSTLNPSELKKQLFTEVNVIKNAFSTYISQLENQLIQYIGQAGGSNIRTDEVSGEVLDQIPKFPASKVTLSLIAAGEDRKYIELLQELANRLEKICVEEASQSLGSIRATFDPSPEMRARFDEEYRQSIAEYKRTLKLIKEDLLLVLVKQLGNKMVPEKEFTREEYVSPRFLVADGFLIDLAEEKPIDPKDPRLLTLLKDYQADIVAQMKLIIWDDFKKLQDPIPLQAKTVFKLCKQIKKKFLQDADFRLHTLPPGEKTTDVRMTIRYPCIPIRLDENTVKYLYDDSIIPGSEKTSLSKTLQSNYQWGEQQQKDPELLFQEAVKRMRLLTTYEESRARYIAAFEKLRTENYGN